MNAIPTRQVISLRLHRLKRNYALIKRSKGMEDIHHFRVEIKKLRAFLRMLQTGRDAPIKIPGSLKKIYHYAGLIRELQLHQQTIKTTGDKYGALLVRHLKCL